MADGQFGGNGSVHWSVDADQGTPGAGVDYAGDPQGRGPRFYVRVRVPDNPAVWIAHIQARAAALMPGSTIFDFELPIDNGVLARTQIRVIWGVPQPADLPNDGMGNRLAEIQART
jgi:hypothetical protein